MGLTRGHPGFVIAIFRRRGFSMENEEKTLSGIGEKAEAVTEAAGEAVEKVTEVAGEAVEKAEEVAGAAADKAAGVAEAAKETVTEAAETVGEVAGAGVEKAEEVAGAAADKVGEVAGAAADTAASAAGAVQGAVSDVIAAPKKSKTPIIIAAVVICALIGVGAAYAAGLFTKPADQVMQAIDKTFVGDDLTAVVTDISDLTADGTYTMDVDFDYSDEYSGSMSADLVYSQDRAAKEQSLSGTIDFMGYSFTVGEYLNDSVMELAVPELLGDQSLSYPYTTAKSGYLVDMMGQDTLDQLDASLKAMQSAITMDTSGGNEKMKAAFKEDFKALTFKKAEAQEVEIDGSKVSCKGYTTTIDKDFMNKLIDDFENSYGGEEFDEYMEAMDTLAGMTGQDTYSDSISNAREAVKDMKPVEVTFLLNKKKLAGILFKEAPEAEENTTEGGGVADADGNADAEPAGVLFHTSDIPWHDTELVGSGSSSRMVVTVEGKTETVKFSSDGTDALEFSYNAESGAFELSSGGESLEGTLAKSGDGYKFDTSFDAGKITLDVKKGAKIDRPAKSFTLDLGTLTEEQYNQLMETVSANVSAMLGF